MNVKDKSLGSSISEFHRDEDGMEALQVVMLVALAAIILIFLKNVLWDRVKNWSEEKVNELAD